MANARIFWLLGLFAFAACSSGGDGTALNAAGGGSGGGAPNAEPPLEPIIPSNVFVVEGDAANDALVEPNQLVFPASVSWLADRKPGDVLVGYRETDNDGSNEFGFLRKVRSVQTVDNSIVIATDPATLEDAVEQGSAQMVVKAPLPSRFDEDAYVQSLPGESAWPGMTPLDLGGLAGGELDFSGRFLVGGDDAYGDAGAGLTLSMTRGKFQFSPDVDLGLRIKWFKVQEFHAIASGDVLAELALKLAANQDWTKSWKLDLLKPALKKPLPPLMIGPVPVVITMVVEVQATGELSVAGQQSVEAGARATSSVKLGAVYRKDDGWSKVSESSFNLEPIGPTFEASVSASVRASAPKVTLKFMIYDAAGPFLSVSPYMSFGVNSPPECNWDLRGGIDGSFGAELQVPVLGTTLAEVSMKLFDWNGSLAHGPLPFCEDAGAGGSGGEGAAGSAGSAGNGAAGSAGSAGNGAAGSAGTAGNGAGGNAGSGASGSAGSGSAGNSPGSQRPDPSTMTCAQYAALEGWGDNLYCETDGNGACQGKGPGTLDCDHCCTGFSCHQLVKERQWSSLRCEVNGNAACKGDGVATFDCDACCGSSCSKDEDCGGSICAWNGVSYCCRAPGATGKQCYSDGECDAGEVCSWNGTAFVCAVPSCLDQ